MHSVSLETSKQTSNPDVMTGWLNDLTVDSGGDCPEYSLSGLITGKQYMQLFKGI